MYTQDSNNPIDRFLLGLEIYSRLEAEYKQTHPEETDLIGSSSYLPVVHQKGQLVSQGYQIRTPELRQVLQTIGPLPPYSALIGPCEDGLPVLLDLSKPEAGSILITGDEGSGKTSLLLSILSSAIILNSPRRFRYAVITHTVSEYESLCKSPHCYQVLAPYRKESSDLIFELGNIAEQRRYGLEAGPALILAIDDLGDVISTLDRDAIDMLLWLIEQGPQSQVWVVAAVDSSTAGSLPYGTIDLFGTWLIGSLKDHQRKSGGIHPTIPKTNNLMPGVQFSVYFEDEWVPFWIPRL